ncbi:carbohydrate ABC transporter permease [Paenibacillus alkalitolerans]|uniref:carbohydrate ABC transporter permease n=1 Tax=Paenibacillus alkalitolerans TaxID=2799335 RepID=UPI0018F34010|nr:sugar ABC transporter permease [Paenibacillus alkalitolerans]
MKSLELSAAVPQRSSIRKQSGPPVRRLLWPSIIVVALVTQIPFLVTIYFSFLDWNLMRPDKGTKFVWFANFKAIITAPEFITVLLNTFILTVCALLICLVFGMILALLMNRDFLGKGVVRTVFIAPFFVMPAVSGIVWKTAILNPTFGITAYFSGLMGQGAVDWLGAYPLQTIIALVSWQWVPFFMLIILAGLQSVPKDAVEAGMIDGASVTQRFIYVVLPHLLRYIEVAMLLGLLFIMQAFGEIYVTTSGGPGYASTNLPFYVYRVGFKGWDIGGASAIGVIIVVITLFILNYLFKFLRRTFRGELS